MQVILEKNKFLGVIYQKLRRHMRIFVLSLVFAEGGGCELLKRVCRCSVWVISRPIATKARVPNL